MFLFVSPLRFPFRLMFAYGSLTPPNGLIFVRRASNGRMPAGSSFVRGGLPLIVLVCGGSFILAQFSKGTVEARDLRYKSQTEHAFNIAEEHSKISKVFEKDYESKPIRRE